MVATATTGGSQKRVQLGRIVGVFGIRGWLKIQSFTRPTRNLLDFSTWWLDADGGFESRIIEIRPQGQVFVAQLHSQAGTPIDDREVAAQLVGTGIWVPLEALPAPPEGSYYWADLIGLNVESESGAPLGQVREMLDNGAQDVLVVESVDGERLIPFVRGPIVRSVNLKSRLIVVAWEPDY